MAPASRADRAFGAEDKSGGFGDNALAGLGRGSPVWVRLQDDEGEDEWASATIRAAPAEGAPSCDVKLAGGSDHAAKREDVVPANPPLLEGIDDLTNLSYLNEPSILHDLRYRYGNDDIYTRAGPVLIAVNPFKTLPLYTPQVMERYRHGASEEPHPYLVVDKAYKNMRANEANQCVIISGESGAGKTETTKISMQYLATLAGGTGVEDQILQTNPVLESFGNAKTLRNHNSSRFGKLIDIHFDRNGRIQGADIETYLLEKSRVVAHIEGERSYHVFYQLCAGAEDADVDRLHLRSAADFNYLNQGNFLKIPGVNDAKDYREMKAAMTTIGISAAHQSEVDTVLAAILWLGNITFSKGDEGTAKVNHDEALANSAELLGVSVDDLADKLMVRNIQAGMESIRQPLKYDQALDSRDALAKALYASLFDWILARINESLSVGKRRSGTTVISILDIYGFESFKRNSFEQLCINFANERLQQQFNQHLFALEQEEYMKEEIDWTQVTFEDNQEAVNLIESRPNGILAQLDDECKQGSGTDGGFMVKLQNACAANQRFKKDPRDPSVFFIKHYAGAVNYDATGFLEKNKDVLHGDLLDLMRSSTCKLLSDFAAIVAMAAAATAPSRGAPNKRGSVSQTQSVGSRFKGQLSLLMTKLNSASPHYIRCIKPNAKLVPDDLSTQIVLHQLRCCGVLEVVRISRQGYPTRYEHGVFADRYSFLIPPALLAPGADTKALCRAVLAHFNIDESLFQFGKTKLFMRAGQIGQMEDLRARRAAASIVLQTEFRRYRARAAYLRTRVVAVLCAARWKGIAARRAYAELKRQWYAATAVQAATRGLLARKAYSADRAAVVVAQLAVRRWVLRRKWAAQAAKRAAWEEAERKRLAEMAAEEERDRMGAAANAAVQARAAAVAKREVDLAAREAEIAAAAASIPQGGGGGGGTGVSQEALDTAVATAVAALAEENELLKQQLADERNLHEHYQERLAQAEASWGAEMGRVHKQIAEACLTLGGGEAGLDEGDFGPDADLPPLQAGARPSPSPSVGSASLSGPSTPSRGDAQQVGAPEYNLALAQVQSLQDNFERHTTLFDDDNEFLKEVKSGSTATVVPIDPDLELRNLKERFQVWKKDFKLRLAETKTLIKKLDNGAGKGMAGGAPPAGAAAPAAAAPAKRKSALSSFFGRKK